MLSPSRIESNRFLPLNAAAYLLVEYLAPASLNLSRICLPEPPDNSFVSHGYWNEVTMHSEL